MSDDFCEVPRCRSGAEMIFYSNSICNRCWHRHCIGEINLFFIFGLTEIKVKKEEAFQSEF
jgi:hypothetical protein